MKYNFFFLSSLVLVLLTSAGCQFVFNTHRGGLGGIVGQTMHSVYTGRWPPVRLGSGIYDIYTTDGRYEGPDVPLTLDVLLTQPTGGGLFVSHWFLTKPRVLSSKVYDTETVYDTAAEAVHQFETMRHDPRASSVYLVGYGGNPRYAFLNRAVEKRVPLLPGMLMDAILVLLLVASFLYDRARRARKLESVLNSAVSDRSQ